MLGSASLTPPFLSPPLFVCVKKITAAEKKIIDPCHSLTTYLELIREYHYFPFAWDKKKRLTLKSIQKCELDCIRMCSDTTVKVEMDGYMDVWKWFLYSKVRFSNVKLYFSLSSYKFSLNSGTGYIFLIIIYYRKAIDFMVILNPKCTRKMQSCPPSNSVSCYHLLSLLLHLHPCSVH